MECVECDRLWETYTGLRLKHRQTILAFRRGDCSEKQVAIAKADMELQRLKLIDHRLSHRDFTPTKSFRGESRHQL